MAGFTLPAGWKFQPYPQDLVAHLTDKVTSKPLTVPDILDLDPYNVELLPDLFSSLRKMKARYLFTKLRSQGKIGGFPIINRQVGNGMWLCDNRNPDKVKENGKLVGMAHKLTYIQRGCKYNRRIQMTEYTLPEGTALKYDPSKDYVLCEITKKGRWNDVSKRVITYVVPRDDSDFSSDSSGDDSDMNTSVDSSADADFFEEENPNPCYTPSPTSSSCTSSESESQPSSSPTTTAQDSQV